jgi:hypothetical protein
LFVQKVKAMSLDEQDVLDRIRCDYHMGDTSLTKLIYGVLGSDACKVEDLEELCEAVPSKNVSGGDMDGDSLALALLDVLDRNIDQTGLVSLACRALQRSTSQACLERFNIRVGKTAFKLLEHHATNFGVTKYVFDLMQSSSCDEAFDLVCNTLAHNIAVLEADMDDLSVPRHCVDSTRAALDLVNKASQVRSLPARLARKMLRSFVQQRLGRTPTRSNSRPCGGQHLPLQ